MRTRKAFGSWLYPAAIILPIWILVGYGFFGGGSGWSILGLLIALPILAVCLAVVATLVSFRVTVRPTRTPARSDVLVVGAWHAGLVAFGFFPAGAWALGLLAVLLGVVAFGYATRRFLGDARATLMAFSDDAAMRASVRPAERADGFDPERPQDGQTLVL